MATSQKSLKAANLAWLWAVISVDAVVVAFIADPQFVADIRANNLIWLRAIVVAAAPVLVLLLSSLLNSAAKAVLVFWRRTHVLPGHRAFSVHAPGDPRIDVATLRKNIGVWPLDEAEQNAAWFRLYKEVETEVTVAQAHKHYLLFRDLATVSLLVVPFVSVALLLANEFTLPKVSAVIALFLVQYLASAIAARNSGIRLVTNVLTLHSTTRRVATKKEPGAKTETKAQKK